MTGTADVAVVYRSGRGPRAWQERAREGAPPGAWPYGLERLVGPGRTVRRVEVPELSSLQRKVVATVGLRPPRRSPDARLAAAWDESTALAMSAGTRAERHFAGVIWSTDAVPASDRASVLRRWRGHCRDWTGSGP